jgi:ribonucleoside-diphosphate reductase alpha chain
VLHLWNFMRINRYFTSQDEDVFASLECRTISIEICHTVAAKRLCIPHFEIPAQWSDEAAMHLAHHYARRAGVPSASARIAEEGVPEWLQRSVPTDDATFGPETSLKQMVHRLVGTWTYWGWNHGYFDTEADAKSFYDEQCYLIAMQRAMPASPQWSNTGLHWAYGISGKANGSYYVDAQSGELCQPADAYERPQHHHYFIQNVADDLSREGGIADLLQREMRVFKHGSGSGCNMSNIRSAAETLSNGLPSAGVAPFLEIGDKAAQALLSSGAQNGSASRLSLIDCDHPDVLRLIRSHLAAHRERVATAIGAPKQRLFYQWILQAVQSCTNPELNAYDPAQNEALAEVARRLQARNVSPKLFGEYVNELRACDGDFHRFCDHAMPSETQQNGQTQIGIRLSDAFMRASAHSQDWAFNKRIDGSIIEKSRAEPMLDEMAHFNWMTGEGLIAFEDHINRWHGAQAAGEIRASSPAGEFLFLDNSACDVAIINLLPVLKSDGELDIEGLEHTTRLQTILCDISIAMAQYPSAEIAYNSYRYRPIGLSMCNLSALLMAMGYAYDSAEGRSIAAALAALITGKGYVASGEMARELGGFEAFADVREGMMHLMWQHHEAAFGRTQHLGTAESCPPVINHNTLPDDELSSAVQRVWDQAMISGDEYGYSNAQISLVGGNPNAAILMDVLSSGIDALGAIDTRNAALRNIMQQGLAQLDYTDDAIRAISAYVFGRAALVNAPEINSQSLLDRGFKDTELTLIEDALARGMDVHSAFDPLHLGERFCRSVLHLSDAQLYDANFKLLYHLGFDEEASQTFEHYINGHQSVVGAPFLRQEDYAIFAIAAPETENKISVEAQIQMAASVQPYISGGIAQRIKTPWNISVKQHRHWMQMSWQLGLKQIMLTRAAMPQTAMIELPEAAAQTVQEPVVQAHPVAQETPAEIDLPQGIMNTGLCIQRSVIAGMAMLEPPAKSQTQKAKLRALPARRNGYVQEAHIGGMLVRHRTEEFEDGSLAVLTLEVPDADIHLHQALQHQATLLTIALQHGVPLSAFEALGSDKKYNPQGDVEGHSQISFVQSVMDYLLRDLLLQYAPQSLFKDVHFEVTETVTQAAPVTAEPVATTPKAPEPTASELLAQLMAKTEGDNAERDMISLVKKDPAPAYKIISHEEMQAEDDGMVMTYL